MKNKKIGVLFLVLSIIGMILSFDILKSYYLIYMGNKNNKKNNYKEAEKYYLEAKKIINDPNLDLNIIKNRYMNEDYDYVAKENHNEFFLKGNSEVKILEQNKSENTQEKIGKYVKILEKYKNYLKVKDDVNIKKNYEIIKKIIDSIQNNQNQNQQEKDNKQNNQNQNQQEKDNKQNNQNQNQQEKDNKQNNQNQDQQEKDNKQNNQNQNQQEEDNKQNHGNNMKDKNSQNIKSQILETSQNNEKKNEKKQEIFYILKQLEGNEKQAFKNNERFINQSNEENSNKW